MADECMTALVPPVSIGALEYAGYYRSKLFSVQDNLSPFVSAAGPVFSLLDRFASATVLPPLGRVIANVEHELRAYYSRLQGQPSSDTQNAIAYYLLCVTIDEVLARSYLRLYGRVEAFKAFTPLSCADETPGQKFFSILSYLKTKAFEQLPLLELVYYCLMAGFEGDQHGKPDGRQVLEAEIDDLFRLIQQYRQVVRVSLFDRAIPQAASPKPYKYVGIMAGCFVVLLFVFFDFSQILVEHQAKKLRFAPTFITTLDE